jgi:hypothetical protein
MSSLYIIENKIPKSKLLHRRIYIIYSRNLALGVWDGTIGKPGDQYTGGFVGIRTKFDNRFLDRESHYEDGPPYGTAIACSDTGVDVGEDIPLECFLETICENCRQPAWWTGPPAPAPWKCNGECEKTSPISEHNKSLFRLLDGMESVWIKKEGISGEETHAG